MMRLIALLCLFAGCGLPNKSFVLDGVSVILENSKGPDINHLSLATHLYRGEAAEYLELSEEQEQQTWRALQQIVWSDRTVSGGADYDAATRIVFANWRGCALQVPLYWAYTKHYLGETEPTEADQDWADAVQQKMAPKVCTGDRAGARLW